MLSTRVRVALPSCPVAASASERASSSSTRRCPGCSRGGGGARRRTSARRSPARAGPPRLLLLAVARPRPRRPDVQSVRRGARSSRAVKPRRASASAQRSCALNRQPPGIDSYTARRTSGCRNRKRRGTSVSRMRSRRSSSSIASIGGLRRCSGGRGRELGVEGVSRDGGALEDVACALGEQRELLGERGGNRSRNVDACERKLVRRGGLSGRSPDRASCSR